MSLKKYKSKFDIIGNDIDKLDIRPYNHCNGQWWWGFYYDWDDDYDDYEYEWEYIEWDYIKLPEIDWGYKVINKSFRNWRISDPSVPGTYVDMESVYGKSEMRNRKIDMILGLREPNYQTTVTLGDFFDRIDKHSN